MNRRLFEQSEPWMLVRATITERVNQLHSVLLSEDDPKILYRTQGSIQELLTLRDEFPTTLPDEVIDGRPSTDPVRTALEH